MRLLQLVGIPGLLTLATLLSGASARAVDVSAYLVKRGLEYSQIDAGLPTVNGTNGYGFAAEVDMPAAGTVTNGSVQPPLGLPAVVLTLSANANKWDYKKKYNSLTALNSHYPDGGYTFTIWGQTDGIRQPTLQLIGSSYPGGPHIANFNSAQAVNPNGYFDVGWDAFSGGTTSDWIQLHIQDALGNKLFETPDFGKPGAYDGTGIRALIAPGYLNVGQTNRATLTFQKNLTTDTTSYPGAIGQPGLYSRTTFTFITTAAPAPDVKEFEVAKASKYVQTSSNSISLQPGLEFVFDANLQAYNTGILTSANVLLPPSNAPRALLMQTGGTTLDYSDTAPTSAGLDLNYPAGTYTLVFTTPHDGSKSIALQMPADAFPQTPRFSNFAGVQTVNVLQPLTVTWDAWAGGTVGDFIQLRIEDLNHNKYFETPDLGKNNALDGRATSAVVPAGVMPTGVPLEMHLTFFRFNRIDTVDYPGVLGLCDFQTRTKVTISTYAAADVKNYGIIKGQVFQQKDSGAPLGLDSNGFQFESKVVPFSSSSVSGATISTPLGAAYPLAQVAGGQQFYFSAFFGSQAGLDTAFPDGTYTEQINATGDGLKNLPLPLSGALYPNPPHVTDFYAAQMADSRSDFPVTWDPFVNGTTVDFVQLRVSDASSNLVFQTPDYGLAGALNGLSTSTPIPAGTLRSNQFYSVQLVFRKMAALDGNTYPGAQGYAAYSATTQFRLITKGSAEPPSLKLTRQAPNGYQVSGEAIAGLSYRIEGSSNLVQWLPLTTNTPTTNLLQWLDPNNRSAFFYRSVVLP